MQLMEGDRIENTRSLGVCLEWSGVSKNPKGGSKNRARKIDLDGLFNRFAVGRMLLAARGFHSVPLYVRRVQRQGRPRGIFRARALITTPYSHDIL